MEENQVAERAAAPEREISEAEAWEMRYQHEASVNQDLRLALLTAQQTIMDLRQRVVEMEGERLEADRRALFARLDLREGDELVLRDGRHILIRAPQESSGPGAPEAGTMPTSGGVPEKEDAGGE